MTLSSYNANTYGMENWICFPPQQVALQVRAWKICSLTTQLQNREIFPIIQLDVHTNTHVHTPVPI